MNYLILALLITSALTAQIEQVHDVIIIGAGISGLRASEVLSENKIEHIVLEASTRIGGRVAPIQFDGEVHDKGATFLHKAKSDNPLFVIAQQNKVPLIEAAVDYKTLYYDDYSSGLLPSKLAQSSRSFFMKIVKQILLNEALSEMKNASGAKDHSVKRIEQSILKQAQFRDEWPLKKKLVHWFFRNLGYNQGTSYEYLSNDNTDFTETKHDYKPKSGMVSLFSQIVKTHKKEINFSSRVNKIDFTGDIVKVHTNNNKVFHAKKVISSIPLGVLKAGKITFSPALPKQHIQAIANIGFGIVDKLFVKVEKPFWKEGVKWINFVTKNFAKNYFPNAYVVPNTKSNIIVFYIPGNYSLQISRLSYLLLKRKLKNYLSSFPTLGEVNIQEIELTKWHSDPNTLGSYSFYKVGCTEEDFNNLASPIASKVWMIGEHTSSENNYFLQGAYHTGGKAALAVVKSLAQSKVSLEKK